mgnify:FL=1|tara:strand:- start:873 stop:1139 length:267 start_codon:yes stop_codon:yes gene_type:complete
MTERFNLKMYADGVDAYEADGKSTTLAENITLERATELATDWRVTLYRVRDDKFADGEIVAESRADGKRYFDPRDGFDWMDVTKTEEI